MSLFHIIEDHFVIMRHKGIYRQCKLYQRDSHFYAGWGNGFVRLVSNNATTAPNVSWLEVTGPHLNSDGRALPRLVKSLPS